MTNAEERLTLKEALDNLYILATNNKNGGWHEGFYEECFDRVVEELEDSISKEKVKELLENEKEIYMRNEDEKVVKELDYISKKILGE